MIMLIRMLGPDYVVWDKAASIRFLRPGRTTLRATFQIDPQSVAAIRTELAQQAKTERLYSVELMDSAGVIHAVVEKRLHIARRPTAP
jgi:hypothetical protein